MFANTKLDSLRLDDAIAKVKREVLVLEDEERAILRQLESMKNMNNSSFWPIPIIHPSGHVNFDNPTYLVIKPCEFCL